MSRMESQEPIAVVGIGCRFPGGANTPAAFWSLLERGVDAVGEIPADRWNAEAFYDPEQGKPGKTHAHRGGFVEGIDRFDPHFFGISPREAARMDPQQRLLLEVAWEAMEDAGQPLERVAGSRTAVFVGVSSWDYSLLQTSFRDRGIIDVHSNTGISLSIAANRISYCFDLRGPSVALDTACSSALVAVHMACKSIWTEGCPLALAGGVSVLLLPDWYIGFSRMGMLSPDGMCKAFDARANGFVRSEGAGMVALKPLSRALADGDRIYALIRGTAVNQDGRTPGMTVPSQEAQESLLREACRSADVLPCDIQYVEAHGTGTLVGDPIEARALGGVFSADRPADRPCLLGSVKTNIGHLEAGAGIAGLIKVALSLHHRLIPKNLHFETPNLEIDFTRLGLRVPVTNEPWPESQGPRLAGVNAFGYGGTNAHAILQSASCSDDKVTRWQGDKVKNGDSLSLRHLVPLSARSAEALGDSARAFLEFLASTPADVSLGDIAGNAALRRTHHAHRLAVVATSRADLAEQLDQHLRHPSAISSGRVPRLAFVFAGQGPQWWGMGRQLLREQPVFRDMIERCDTILRGLGPWSLLAEMSAPAGASRMEETAVSQPAIFALQVALVSLWQSWGVRPEVVVGHSVGEVAAAYLAGVFGLEDAVRIIYQRGRCMDRASSRGRMLAAGVSAEEAEQLIAGYADRVAIAAINSPSSVTLSGEAGPLEAIGVGLESRGLFARMLQVEYAFHSAQMDPVRDELLASLQGIRPRAATLPLFSTVTGKRVIGEEMGPEYWWRNVRQTVRFLDGIAGLIEYGCDVVVELSPHPVLTTAVSECYQQRGKKVTTLQSLRRPAREGRPPEERASMLRSLGALYALGVSVDWQALHGPNPARFISLPLYPWQRERCWHESEESRASRLLAPVHPLLGRSAQEVRPTWGTRLDLRLLPWLGDHRVQRTALLPASAYIELAFAAVREAFGPGACELEDVKLTNPCFLTPDKPLWLQTAFDSETNTVQVHTRSLDRESIAESGAWTAHMSVGRTNLIEATRRPHPPTPSPKGEGEPEAGSEASTFPYPVLLPPLLAGEGGWGGEVFASPLRWSKQEFTREQCVTNLQKIGLDYGPSFQGIERAWQGEGESLGLVRLPAPLMPHASEYLFHPALLDLCFQVAVVADPGFGEGGGLYLPTEIERVRLYRSAGPSLWCHARVRLKTTRTTVVDFDIYDEAGQLVARVMGLRSQRVMGDKEETLDDLLGAYQWQREESCSPLPRVQGRGGPETRPGTWLIFADRSGLGAELASRLFDDGEECLVLSPGETDLARLIEAMPSPCRGIVHLWNLDAPLAEDLTTADLEETHEPGLQSIVHLVQAWEEVGGERPTRLLIATRGAQPVDGDAIEGIAQSSAIGLGRVIAGEYPRLRCRLVDLDPGDADGGLHSLLDELRIDDDEDEVARRGPDRFVHRYMPTPGQAHIEAADRPYRLTTPEDRTLDSLRLQAIRRQPVEPGHVEIEVVAAGLNFSDVMKVLGIYPGLDAGPVPLGAECSGIVTAIGAGVDDVRVGDEVMAVAPFSLGSHVTTRAELVVAKPAHLSFEEAATAPIAFLTAAYALEHLGAMSKGDRVLIHSASGGVGLAALQLTHLAGAEVFATAGTPEKREYLRGLGVEHLMDSRSLAFADEVMRDTHGAGVDLILNSLPGEAIARGLDCLADSGRFLEIGKRDIYKNTRVGLRPFRNNLSFFAIDLDRVMRQRPALLGTLLRDIARRLCARELTPLPHRTWPISDAVEAFRYMQQGKHIGKIVLSLRERPTSLAPAEDVPLTLRADASYLITGGLGGFGLVVARWMVERGARHLVLVGRSGAHTPEALAAVAELQEMGAWVVVCRADVSRAEDVESLFVEVDRLPPLRGVVHAAMVLEDSLLVNLDRSLMRRVLAPKVSGAWNLHLQTRERPLDFFVLFSSLSSVFGHAGQGNYAAANAFLDALAWHRRASGLPALTINWGALGEVGYLAQRTHLGERLERQGIRSFSVRQALALLDRAITRELTQVSVLRIDWSRWRGLGVTGRISPRFAHLCRSATETGEGVPDDTLTRDTLLAATPAERAGLLESLLRDKIARVLGTSPARLEADTVLLGLGFDSLMAVELRNWIESELRVNVPIMELMRSPSLARLTQFLEQHLNEPTRNGHTVPKEEVRTGMQELSGDQVDAMLASLMAKKEQGASMKG